MPQGCAGLMLLLLERSQGPSCNHTQSTMMCSLRLQLPQLSVGCGILFHPVATPATPLLSRAAARPRMRPQGVQSC